MKLNHLLSVFATAGILLPAQPAAAITTKTPESGSAINQASQKKAKVKKGKAKKSKKKKENKTEALAKKIFNATDEQKQKARATLEALGNPDLKTAIKGDNDKAVVAHLICGADAEYALRDALEANKPKYVKICIAAPGIDVNKMLSFLNEEGTRISSLTALSFAAMKGHTQIVKLLLQAPSIDVKQDEPLCKASSNGHVEIVKLLLKQPGIDVNAGAPLACAASASQMEIVKLLLKQPGIDVNERAPLACAARSGQLECVKLLLQAPGIDVNKDGPLCGASFNGHVEIVRLLLQHKCINVNQENGSGTPLSDAAYNGQTEIVKLLLAHPGIDVKRRAPLVNAAYQGHLECVKILLNTPGVDVNAPDEHGNWEKATALHLSISNKHEEIARLLLQQPGINVNTVDMMGNTPISTAANEGNTEMIKLLINAPGFDASAWNPITLAVLQDDIAQLKSLIKAKKDVNKADGPLGTTPLHWAVETGRTECLRILVKVPGIDANKAEVKNRVIYLDKVEGGGMMAGYTPLHLAAEKDRPECIKLLLTVPGIDPNITMGQHAKAPLHLADAECFKLLVSDPRVDVNKATRWGYPPLASAAENGNLERVKLLLSNPKIDVNRTNPNVNDKTALQMATEKGHTEIIKQLEAAGAK